MKDSIESVRKQITENEKNLRLIEERKAEYVQATDIPLQIIKDERRLQQEYNTLKEKLRELEKHSPAISTPSSQVKRTPYIRAWQVSIVGLVVGVGAITFAIFKPPPNGNDRPQLNPTLKLGDVVPPEATKIAVAVMSNCPEAQNTLVKELQKVFLNKKPQISVEKLQKEVQDTTTARSQGAEINAELVIWGRCSQNTNFSDVNFEILIAKGTPEVYEPKSLLFHSPSESQVLNLAEALGKYLHRDYADVASTFDAIAAGFASNSSSKALLQLIQGNNLLFTRKYSEAIEVYQKAIKNQPNQAGLYHNLGVAYLNQVYKTYEHKSVSPADFKPAIKTLNRAIQLEPKFKLSHISLGEIWVWLGSVNQNVLYLQNAETSCQKANSPEVPQKIQAQAKVCLATIQIVRYNSEQNGSLQNVDKMGLLKLNTSYWSMPLLTQGTADYFRWRQDMKSETIRNIAQKNLNEALHKMEDDVNLENSRARYEGAKSYLNKLQSN
ncbi:tetratricopeptide repeat protein [Nostoc sp. UIC 10630]|uniref:tetratricopeptide repeat protein n=1 Tax=Nostoc sp. UIC 10630 TaxID=2100146 RepID=UPI0013D33332|nr:tetratricopeptide repeat protein [Nostoc sp. UIC 10630]NEU81349.1 tetratricopeptide repeat protein [Nostoc sp. UIC 10630]